MNRDGRLRNGYGITITTDNVSLGHRDDVTIKDQRIALKGTVFFSDYDGRTQSVQELAFRVLNSERRVNTWESLAAAANSRATTAETRAANAEVRADAAETRANDADSRAYSAETRAIAAETRVEEFISEHLSPGGGDHVGGGVSQSEFDLLKAQVALLQSRLDSLLLT